MYLMVTSKYCLYFDESNVETQGFINKDMLGDLNSKSFWLCIYFCRGSNVMLVKITKLYCFFNTKVEHIETTKSLRRGYG